MLPYKENMKWEPGKGLGYGICGLMICVGICMVNAPAYAASTTSQNFLCFLFGFAVRPFGLCDETRVSVPKPQVTESHDPSHGRELNSIATSSDGSVEVTDSGSSHEIIQPITYIQEGIDATDAVRLFESRLDERLATLTTRTYIGSVSSSSMAAPFSDDLARALWIFKKDNENTRSDLNENINDVRALAEGISSGGTFSEVTLTGDTTLTGLTSNALLFTDGAGVLTASPLFTIHNNRLGIGTTSPSELLTVEGAIYLGSEMPASIANRLYNVAGDLYWNGAVLSGSSTASWMISGGNAYRMTGSVGIGTTTPVSLLSVEGPGFFGGVTGTSTISHNLSVGGRLVASSIKAPVYDTGGHVCNVKAYGAVGDNASDNYAAIMAAISDCPDGGIIQLPPGVYRISQTIVLDRPVTLQGTYAPRWYYASTPRSSIKPTSSFGGTSIIHVRDRTISGESDDNNGGRFVNLSIDGNSYGSGIHGIRFEGLVRDWKIENVDISQTSGNAVTAEKGSGSGNPRGFTITHLSIYSPGGHGVRATALTDSYLEDILVVGGAQRGFYFTSMGETKLVGSRAVFNALEGLYIDGSSSNGGFQVTDFSTDRNDRHGVRISATGTTTITFSNILTRRDGANDGGGSETPYAGIAVIGSTTALVAPVIIQNLSQITGVDDNGAGTPAPSLGVRVEKAEYVKIDGVLWGTDQAYLKGEDVDTFIIEEETLLKTGYATVTEELYNQKWLSSSDSVYYMAGNVGIGTTTPTSRLYVVGDASTSTALTVTGVASQSADYFRIKSTDAQEVGDILTVNASGYLGVGTTTMPRRLAIAGTENVGARFTDTTNMTAFDLRVEDFQAFIGTQSNHDVRFITAGTSRVAIDTSGRMGVGTTSPWRTLSVSGTAAFSGLTPAGGNGSALCLADGGEMVVNIGAQTCTVSSKRFKNGIESISPEAAAHIASSLRPVSFTYKNSDELRVGLIAEEVAEVDERLIFTEPSGLPRGVRYEDLVSILIGAFQHQQAQIAVLLGGAVESIGEAMRVTFDSVFARTIEAENIRASTIEAEDTLEAGRQMCIDGVCITGIQLRELMEDAGLVPGQSIGGANTQESQVSPGNEDEETQLQNPIDEDKSETGEGEEESEESSEQASTNVNDNELHKNIPPEDVREVSVTPEPQNDPEISPETPEEKVGPQPEQIENETDSESLLPEEGADPSPTS